MLKSNTPSSAASRPLTASRDHALSTAVPSASPISGISTAYAMYVTGVVGGMVRALPNNVKLKFEL